MKQRALILGVSGKVGEGVADLLLGEGWEVFGAARFSDPTKADSLRAKGIEPIVYDVIGDDPAALPEVDVVFLEIWDPSRPDLIWPINFYGVGRVVEHYAGRADFVNGCTINVYGATPEAPSEDAACRPDTDYGRSRYSQERLIDYFCHRSGSNAIHVRYAHANSATGGFIRRMAVAIAKGESLGPNPDARLRVIGLEDFVRVTVAARDRVATPPPAVNCCGLKVWTQRELAEAIHSRLGRGEGVFDRPSGGLEQSVQADPSRMVEWFGPPTVDQETMIERVVATLRDAG